MLFSLLALGTLSAAALAQVPPTATVSLDLTTPTLSSGVNSTTMTLSPFNLTDVVLQHDQPASFLRGFNASLDRSTPGTSVLSGSATSSGSVSLQTSGNTSSGTLSYSQTIAISKDVNVANTNSLAIGGDVQDTYSTNLGRLTITAKQMSRSDMPNGFTDPAVLPDGRITANTVNGLTGSITGREACIATWHAFGLTQAEPILPSSGSAGNWTFTNVPSGFWYDPPIATSFVYQATGTTRFTRIDELPTGFNTPFLVKVGAITIGSFFPGQFVDFEWLLGQSVSQFSIHNIDPGVDSANQNAFPVKTSFAQPTGSFTMTAGAAVPEPGSLVLVAVGALALVGRRKRYRL